MLQYNADKLLKVVLGLIWVYKMSVQIMVTCVCRSPVAQVHFLILTSVYHYLTGHFVMKHTAEVFGQCSAWPNCW